MNRTDAVKIIGISTHTLDVYAKNGRIKVSKIGNKNDYDEKEVIRLRDEIETIRNKPPVERNYKLEYVERFKENWRKMQRSYGIC